LAHTAQVRKTRNRLFLLISSAAITLFSDLQKMHAKLSLVAAAFLQGVFLQFLVRYIKQGQMPMIFF
jgi:hypothetical protein